VTSRRIEKLRRGHAIDAFDCGREALNRFLVRYVFPNQQAEASQTYVALAEEEVIGYYTVVVCAVEYSGAPERLTKGLARHPVPIMLLARLAVSTSWQGKGVGAGLLKDAMPHPSMAWVGHAIDHDHQNRLNVSTSQVTLQGSPKNRLARAGPLETPMPVTRS